MKLKNILIVVKDIEKSKQFYHDLFGLEVIRDFDGNVILTEGLVLQEERIWRKFLGKRSFRKVIPVSCILRKEISRDLLKSLKICTRLRSMSIV